MICGNCFANVPNGNDACPFCGNSIATKYSERHPEALPLGYELKNRYIIGDQLGKGGFALTYHAYDIQYKRHVCMKEFYPVKYVSRNTDSVSLILTETGDSEKDAKTAEVIRQLADEFRGESQILFLLNKQPNIINALDFFESNNTSYYVMDLLTGQSMRDFTKEGGFTGEDVFLSVFLPVMDALQYCHENGIIHCDVSPGNIMICKNDKGELTPVLIDFGTAYADTPTFQRTFVKRTKTPGYSPPNQKDTPTPSHDIYSLSACMYEVIMGSLPSDRIGHESDASTILLTDSDDKSKTFKVRSAILKAIDAGLGLTPGKSYASMNEMKADMLGKKKKSPLPFIILAAVLLLLGAGAYLFLSGEIPLPDFVPIKLPARTTEPVSTAEDTEVPPETTLPPEDVVSVTGVTLEQPTLEVNVGYSFILKASVQPEDATNKAVTWISTDEKIAIVDGNGLVTGVAPGTTTVIVITEDGSKSAVCSVKIKPLTVDAEAVTLNKEALILMEKSSGTLTAQITPADTTDKTIKWSSSAPEVAKVDEKGNVTAVKTGKAVITATASNGKTATCEITVTDLEIKATAVSVTPISVDMIAGESRQLYAILTPSDSTSDVSFSSSDTSVCYVDSNGLMTAVGTGTARITARAESLSADCTVYVTNPPTSVTLNVGDSFTLERGTELQVSASVYPSNADQTWIEWTSSDTSVATVDESGYITPQAPGSAVITASTAGGVSASFTLIVPGITTVRLNADNVTLNAGELFRLSADLEYLGDAVNDFSFTLHSANSYIASVYQDYIYARHQGETDVTLLMADGASAVCHVTVYGNLNDSSSGGSYDPPPTYTYPVTNPNPPQTTRGSSGGQSQGRTFSVTTSPLTIDPGGSGYRLPAPQGAGWSELSVWSDNTSIVTVSKTASQCVIMGMKAGTTTIHFSNGSMQLDRQITVTRLTDSGTIGSNIQWSYDNGDLTLSGSSTNSVDMPNYRAKGAPWYKYAAIIRHVKIGAGITSVGDYAFYDCSALESVDLKNKVLSFIGTSAFEGCSALKALDLPDTVTGINRRAFAGCSTLRTVAIPRLVTQLNASLFEDCESLQSVSFKGAVLTIGDSVFSGCTSISSITIPSSVTSVGVGAFDYWTSSQTITVQGASSTPSGWNSNWSGSHCRARINWGTGSLVIRP